MAKCKSKKEMVKYDDRLEMINPNAAFVDIGSGEHWVCIPPSRGENHVRWFGAFTKDLRDIRDWLLENGVTSVAMESTGVYWINLYTVLEEAGLEVLLVNARELKNVKGRPKTDKLDAKWGQRLHSYGLLRGSFRPEAVICAIRDIWRMREKTVENISQAANRMGKALYEMNVLLPKVVTDITGKTGMSIIRAIVDGERNPEVLSRFRDPRCKKSQKAIAAALDGNYRDDRIFCLGMALNHYQFLLGQLELYDAEIDKRVSDLPIVRELSEDEKEANQAAHASDRKKYSNTPAFDARTAAHELTGVDIAAVPGFSATLSLCVLFETGLDMEKWPSAEHFASWLGLCPNIKRSAGRYMSTSTKKCASHAASYFRQAAVCVSRSQTTFGDFFRRMRARHGGAHAVTATARKLAVLVYTLLKNKEQYKELDRSTYQKAVLEQRKKNLEKRAAKLGFKLVPAEVAA